MMARLHSFGSWLVWLALAAHFVQVAHFAAIPHELGPDGALHHVHRTLAGDDQDGHRSRGHDDQHPTPAGDHDRDDGDRCPLLPPALDPCDPGDALPLLPSLLPNTTIDRVPHDASPPLAPLTLAPKHSPPVARVSRC